MFLLATSNKRSIQTPLRRGHDLVMLLYLVTGTLGLTFITLMLSASEGWAGLYLITALTSAIGWIPGAFLIVVHRHSWRVAIPAAILVICLVFLLHVGAMHDLTITLTLFFYVTAFLVGVNWLIQKFRK